MFNYSFYKSRAHIVWHLFKGLSISKMSTLLLNQAAYMLKLERAAKIPSIITLQLTYDCNLKCIMCQKSSIDANKYTMNSVAMDFDKLSTFIRKNKNHLSVLRITGGEPLLYPHFEPLLDLLNEVKINFTILSNGSLFTEALVRKMLKYCVGISISLDSVKPDNYAYIRKGGDLNRLIENIALINKLKQKQKTPFLNIAMTCFSFNIMEMEEMVAFCYKHNIPTLSVGEGMYYNTSEIKEEHFIRNNPLLINDAVNRAQAKADKLGVTLRLNSPVLYFAKEDNALISNRNPIVGCPDYYTTCIISPEFELKICAPSDAINGIDIAKDDLFWNTEILKKNRKLIRDNQFPDTCRYCIDYNANYNKAEEYSFIDFQKRSKYWKIE